MIQIKELKTLNQRFSLEELWAAYLFSTFFLFFIRHKCLTTKTSIIIIEDSIKENLRDSLTSVLKNLLDQSYSDPSIREYQRHPTRFEKILLDGKVYKVNYRLSEIGRMSYAIYNLIKFVEKAETENEEILIEVEW